MFIYHGGMNLNRKVMVIAAHPDDEILGCGGTIARHVNNGDEVQVVIMVEGLTSRDDQRCWRKRQQELNELSETAYKANRMLGVSSLKLHNFPDNRTDSLNLLDIVKVTEKFVADYKPETIYTHHAGDLNIDHRKIHQAVVTACRPVPHQLVRTLLFFEIPSNTEWQTAGSAPYFMPNWFTDISETLDLKLEALKEYTTEIRDWPHARSLQAVESLAHWRGASIGVEAAEAFQLGRLVV